MAHHINKCKICNGYTMDTSCQCGGDAVLARPPKYSPEDKYADYRRKAKIELLKQGGIL